MMRAWSRQQILTVGVFAACLVPLALLVRNALTNNLGANPIAEITAQTGIWTLRFLLLTLAITPLRRLMGWNRLIQWRRMLGLMAFFYGGLHFVTYIWLDQFFVLQDILIDVMERPFITVGFVSFVLLIPLAITSTTKMIRRLGGRWWQRLHRLIYVIAVGSILHYWWLVKADIREPLIYGSVLGVLLAFRLWMWSEPHVKLGITHLRKAAASN